MRALNVLGGLGFFGGLGGLNVLGGWGAFGGLPLIWFALKSLGALIDLCDLGGSCILTASDSFCGLPWFWVVLDGWVDLVLQCSRSAAPAAEWTQGCHVHIAKARLAQSAERITLWSWVRAPRWVFFLVMDISRCACLRLVLHNALRGQARIADRGKLACPIDNPSEAGCAT